MKNKQLILLLIVDVIFFVFLTNFVIHNPHILLDARITHFFQSLGGEAMRYLMIFVSVPGYGILKYSLLPIAAAFLFYKKLKKEAGILLFSSLGAVALSNFIKGLIHRPRPDAAIIDYVFRLEKTFSYPSGHVVYYMGFFGFLLFISLTKLKGRSRAVVSSICIFFLALVGPSRIYLGAHWFTDVLAGYIVGLAWLLVSILVYNSWTKNEKSKN